MADKKKKNDLAKLEEEFEEMRSLLQRTQADFVNYRRRTEESRSEFAKLAHSDIVEQILPVLDNFQMAAKHVPEDLATNNWVVGVQAIEKQMEQILMANGLERIEAVGKDFDPNLYEAVGETEDKTKANHIVISEEAPGYMLNGKLLRPAKVIVNNTK